MQSADLVLVHASELLTCRTGEGGAVGAELEQLDVIPDGAVAIVGERIAAVGPSDEIEARWRAESVIDAGGRVVSPGLIDPHSHLVYAGSRHEEYESSITGKNGATLGGGIRCTVDLTRSADAAQLKAQALRDLDVMMTHGTTTLEAKSGYGLDRDTELKLLSILAELRHPVDVIPTYLGAHVPPRDGSRGDYVELVRQTLPAARAYADVCDVCCDPIGFTADECERIAEEALRLGFRLRVHADQTGYAGGAELAARFSALSADHLDFISDEGVIDLAAAGTTGVLVPGVTFHLMETMSGVEGGRASEPSKPFLPSTVHQMIEGGVRLALSTDYNPGSSPTPSMQMAMQLAARVYRLSYAAVWNMSTTNAAYAMGCADDRGSIEVGKRADLAVWNVREHGMVIHRFGVNHLRAAIKNGVQVVEGAAP